MVLRIAIGAMMQETNDFSPVQSTRETFTMVLRGAGILQQDPHPPPAEVNAFVAELNAWSEPVEIIPLATIAAMSSGRMTADCHQWARDELLSPLRKAGAVDGVLLCLHGAMVADGEEDPEGALLESVREIVGVTVPICASLDLHVHLTRRMAIMADVLCIYHKIPHIDMAETGQRTAEALRRILLEDAQPISHFIKLPLHLPVERVNTEATPEDVQAGKYAAFPPWVSRYMRQLEKEPWCLSAGLGTTQPWLNVEDLGATFLIVSDATVPEARETGQCVAEELATKLWEARDQYMPSGNSLLSVEEAVSQAHAHATRGARQGVVAIGDGADATTSGAPGDSTWLLQELLRYSWPSTRPALVTVVSPEAVAQAEATGIGGVLAELSLGGVQDNVYAVPCVVTAVVERLFNGSYDVVRGHCAGQHFELQGCATVRLVHPNSLEDTGVRVILTTGIGAHFAVELFELGGYDPFEASAVICKSPAGFRATYGERAGLMVSADAAGCAPAKFWEPQYSGSFPAEVGALYPWALDRARPELEGAIEIFESALVQVEVEEAEVARL